MCMAVEVGFVKCGDCGARATVFEYGGQKVGTFYTKCGVCGTTSQGGGIARQEQLKVNTVKTVADYEKKHHETVIDDINNPDKTVSIEKTVSDTVIKTVKTNDSAGCELYTSTQKNNEITIKKGFFAMFSGLAIAAGLFVGYKVGVNRG